MDKYTKIPDERLWLLLQNPEETHEVFSALYDRHGAAIYTYCLKILGSEEAARDVIQEVFLRLYEKRSHYKEMPNLMGFLIRIARNICINEKNKKSADNIQIDELEIPYYDSPYYKKQLSEIINLAIEELDEEFREPLVLKEFMNLSYKEIAELLDTTLPLIRVRIYRAKAKLKKILHPYLKEIDAFE